jgi:hypothetical protein
VPVGSRATRMAAIAGRRIQSESVTRWSARGGRIDPIAQPQEAVGHHDTERLEVVIRSCRML